MGITGGLALLLLVHTWAYGSPLAIGYWLRPIPAEVLPSFVASSSSPWWNAFFPYGFSLHQLWNNVRAAFFLGVWPWVLLWSVGMILTSVRVWREGWQKGEKLVLACLAWTGIWLLFYYGQGRFADHIGGQAMHLGNSFLRYLAPFWMLATWWAGWVILSATPLLTKERGRGEVMGSRGEVHKSIIIPVLLLIGFSLGGLFWSLTDPEDGLLRGRHEREHYASVRTFVLQHTSSTTIWVSDRSDKMLFPARMATANIPAPEQLRAFLEAKQGDVWMYRRPVSQQERDRFTHVGIELIERERFPREIVYEARLR